MNVNEEELKQNLMTDKTPNAQQQFGKMAGSVLN